MGAVATVKNTFICFIGNDGSGKSTLAKALVDALREYDVECQYVVNRFEPYAMKPFLFLFKIAFFNNEDMFRDYIKYHEKKKKLFKKPLVTFAYKQFLFVDYLIQTFIKIKMPMMLGKNIVSDRYIYDTVISHCGIHLNYTTEKINKTIRNSFYLMPKPDLVFLMDIPDDVAFRRKNDIPSIDYLAERRELYLEIGKEFDMVILDASQDLEALKKDSLSIVIDYMKSRRLIKCKSC